MRKISASVIVAVFFLLFFTGCNIDIFNFKKDKSEPPQQTNIEPTRKINGPLLAKVNSWAIGVNDFQSQFDDFSVLTGAQYEDTLEGRKDALSAIVSLEILAQEAKRRELDKDQALQDKVHAYERVLLVERLNDDIRNDQNLEVTDEDVRNFYEENKTIYFLVPPKVKIKELAVNSEILANDIYVRLLQGDNFESLARTYSVLASKDKGGDLGEVEITNDKRNENPKYWTNVLVVGKGKLSSIFDIDGKYYIIKVEDKTDANFQPFEDVESKIRSVLRSIKLSESVKRIENAFREKNKDNIVINEDLLQ